MTIKLTRRGFIKASAMTAGAMAVPALAAERPIRIGWLSSLTGPLSSAAIAENHGVQFAVNQINAAGGVGGRKLDLLTRDTQGDPTKAVNFAQQLAFSEKVDFVIGPVNSGESLATVPILAHANIPNIIIGTVDKLTNPAKYPLAFRAINTNTQWIEGTNHYTLDVLKKSKIAIIGDTTGYGTSTVDSAKRLLSKQGVTPVYTTLVKPNQTDLSDEMNKAQSAGANVLMPWSAATGLLARILNARGNMGWDVPIVGHPALMGLDIQHLLNKPSYWNNTYAIGYKCTTFDKSGNLPKSTQRLMKAIRPKLKGGKIDFTFWWVALGYDTVQIIQHAVKKAGSTDAGKIKTALESTSDLKEVYAAPHGYSWAPHDHNGFPTSDLAMDVADTFKEGSFQRAPR